jgi:hypothetical protein
MQEFLLYMQKSKILFALVLCCPLFAMAQYKDAGLWANFSLAGKFNKDFQYAISPEVRMNENISRAASFFMDFGSQYKLNKHFSFSASYRIGGRNDGVNIGLRQRFQLGAAYKEKVHDFGFSLQTRIQAGATLFAAENDADFTTVWRNKMGVKYTGLKKTDFGMSFELFNLSGRYQNFAMQTWRWITDVERKLNDRNSVSIGYLIQRSLLKSPIEMDYILLLSWQYSLDASKEKSDSSDKGN